MVWWFFESGFESVHPFPKALTAVFDSLADLWQFGYVHGVHLCDSLQEVSIIS